MAQKFMRFLVEIPDNEVNGGACEDLGDMIDVSEAIAEAVGDLGFSAVKVKEFVG